MVGENNARELLVQLSNILGVDLEQNNDAIAGKDETATAKLADGSIEATVQTENMSSIPAALITAPRAPGIRIEVFDPSKAYAPAGALYEIRVFDNREGECRGRRLSGDVDAIYVGANGIMLPK